MVTGQDLIQAGLKPGKDFGELLRRGRMLHFSGLERAVALRQLLGEYQKMHEINANNDEN